MKLFADDSSLFARVKDATCSHEQLIGDLNTITKWAKQWKMEFNPTITKQAIEVIFSSKYKKETHPPLVFNGIPVARETSTKHLGIILDDRLTFRKHIQEAITKAKKGLAVMKFLSKWVNSTVLDKTYKMYVRPHLDYGDVIYHDQLVDMMNALESIQYQAGLIITKCWKGTNKLKVYNELGWEVCLGEGYIGDLHYILKLKITIHRYMLESIYISCPYRGHPDSKNVPFVI